MTSHQEILLNFLPLSDARFYFSVYRRQFVSGEKSENFPNCTKRPLPPLKGVEEYNDYWITFEEIKQDGFSKFECDSDMNPYLTNEFLFKSLLRKCKENGISGYYVEEDSFNNQRIYFVLEQFQE